ncbi:DUF1810 domain-containing protein [Acidovorax sp. DW039]|uniref:DUF1810 domain-containing protein n=1 Tax=Acidovorax sp. DW039 TaxID=3095606 RepID=UPI0030D62732
MPLPPVLDRFLQAQEPVWSRVQNELKSGKKRTHWMWFVFPQFKGLGRSETAARYAIQSVAEGKAYLSHPVLGSRLRECCHTLAGLESTSALDVFGTPDDLKLHSCMTLFSVVSNNEPVFQAVLDKFFDGRADPLTLDLIE